jgi:hypothetical protein
MSCRGRSREAPGLHLERARDRAGGSKLLGAPTIGGGSAGPGVVVDRFIEVTYTFTAIQNSQNQRKNGWLCAHFGL